MERVKVQVPVKSGFSTIITIRITDLNYGGHVGNDVFLSLVHEARQQFLHYFGYSELTFEGVGLIMADAALEYKRELNYADTVKISVTASGFDKIGFDLYYLLEVKAGEDWLIAGKVKTGMVCFDYALKKKVAVPAAAVQKLTGTQD
jgi:acyl-CoA thioester hydrolase